MVQKAAMKLNIEPRLDFGWNSAKYDQITGPLPPKLLQQQRKKNPHQSQCFIVHRTDNRLIDGICILLTPLHLKIERS